jgi:hypothetical protein
MGRAARDRARTAFNYQTIVPQYEALYEGLIGET